MIYDISILLQENRSICPAELLCFLGTSLLIPEPFSVVYRLDGNRCCGQYPSIHPCEVLEFNRGDILTVQSFRYSEFGRDFVFDLRFSERIICISRRGLGGKIDYGDFQFVDGDVVGKSDKRNRPIGYMGQG